MEKAALFDAVIAQRHRLIGVLDGLSDEQWNTQSLCEKWRVRDVVGHLVSVLDIPAGRFLWRSFRARSFDNYSAGVACDYGSQDAGQLLAQYRDLADKQFAPPIVGPIAPYDRCPGPHPRHRAAARYLGATLHPEGLRAALDYCCGGQSHRLCTWKAHQGPPIRGNRYGLVCR